MVEVETPTINAFPARRFLVGKSPVSEAFTTTWAQLHAHNDYHLAGQHMLRQVALLEVKDSVQMLSGRTLTRLPDVDQATTIPQLAHSNKQHPDAVVEDAYPPPRRRTNGNHSAPERRSEPSWAIPVDADLDQDA